VEDGSEVEDVGDVDVGDVGDVDVDVGDVDVDVGDVDVGEVSVPEASLSDRLSASVEVEGRLDADSSKAGFSRTHAALRSTVATA